MPVPDGAAPRVLVVDDSSAVRAALAKGLAAEGLQVVAGASDPYMARDLIFKLKPDVLTLDLQMPNMDGLTFLQKIMAYRPMPVVILSSLTAGRQDLILQALELGAIEVFPKPSGDSVAAEMAKLAQSLRRASGAKFKGRVPATILPSGSPSLDPKRVVAVGASTGGTVALASLISGLPGNFPPLLIVQHMPPGFTQTFAQRLDGLGKIRVSEAKDGDFLAPGLALLAPGGQHMTLQRQQGRLRVRCREGAPVNHVAPSVDVLFHSIAQCCGPKSLGVLLTGMGKDGAQGLLEMRHSGAPTLAQDEASSVIWGMPGEAQRLGAVDALLPLEQMAGRICKLLEASPALEG
jgi:two-component system chemotaxis response regulator CheB